MKYLAINSPGVKIGIFNFLASIAFPEVSSALFAITATVFLLTEVPKIPPTVFKALIATGSRIPVKTTDFLYSG